MGQKCACLKKEGETNTVLFPSTERTTDDVFKTDYIVNAHYSKAISKIKIDDLNVRENYNYEKYTEENITNLFPETKNLNDHQFHIVKIQKMYRCYLQRKIFLLSVKKKLILESKRNIQLLKMEFNFDELVKIAETKFQRPNLEAWKLQMKKLFHVNFGKNYYKDMLKKDENSFFIGYVNILYQKHGFGTQFHKDGTIQEGYWFKNELKAGRIIDSLGNLNEGLFEKGKLNGKGTQILEDCSNTYIGEFKCGNRDGRGKETCDEYSYEGTFKNGMKEGKGTLNYKKTNDKYTGEFVSDTIHGMGLYLWSNQHSYKGIFASGKMNGHGVYKWPDGSEYVGNYINNVMEGKGVFKWPNGRQFTGPFRNGNPHGIGLLNVNGKSQKVEFVEGKINKLYNEANESYSGTLRR